MRMQKRKFRIGELAKHLNVEKFVVRFWEKEFGMSTIRSDGGQRFYDEDDLNRFQTIKTLLYDQGFTIAGARKYLDDGKPATVVGSRKTTIDKEQQEAWHQDLADLKQHLMKLSELL